MACRVTLMHSSLLSSHYPMQLPVQRLYTRTTRRKCQRFSRDILTNRIVRTGKYQSSKLPCISSIFQGATTNSRRPLQESHRLALATTSFHGANSTRDRVILSAIDVRRGNDSPRMVARSRKLNSQICQLLSNSPMFALQLLTTRAF